MKLSFPYRIMPMGDQALTLSFDGPWSEELYTEVRHLDDCLRSETWPGIGDVVSAYASVTVFYNMSYLQESSTSSMTVFDTVKSMVLKKIEDYQPGAVPAGRLIKIPVCYESPHATDLAAVANWADISEAEVIDRHTAVLYQVYMIGFLPGFPYLGRVDEQIAMGRKAQPVPVLAGSVGIAGMQSGIYPLDSPGGWQIIGRTPLHLFDAQQEQPCLLQPGDKVRFFSISKNEFDHYTTGLA